MALVEQILPTLPAPEFTPCLCAVRVAQCRLFFLLIFILFLLLFIVWFLLPSHWFYLVVSISNVILLLFLWILHYWPLFHGSNYFNNIPAISHAFVTICFTVAPTYRFIFPGTFAWFDSLTRAFTITRYMYILTISTTFISVRLTIHTTHRSVVHRTNTKSVLHSVVICWWLFVLFSGHSIVCLLSTALDYSLSILKL
jgi:hypothetical protein